MLGADIGNNDIFFAYNLIFIFIFFFCISSEILSDIFDMSPDILFGFYFIQSFDIF